MSERLAWLEGLLLPVRLRSDLVRARLSGREDPVEVSVALARWGSARQRRGYAAQVCQRAREIRARVVVPGDVQYPQRCLQLADPPAALFLRGEPGLLSRTDTVGVVGTRRGTERGRLVAERIGAGIARAGAVVVSGLAYGVDGASHKGALAAGGQPVGVLGTGIDIVYPAGHLRLQEEVARAGCLVTEYEPHAPARKHQFLARNRLIAALSTGLVVVEAGRESGALSTVDFALQLGRDVLVVPGPVDCPHAQGCLQLLRDGATPVRDAEDVMESLRLPIPAAPPAAPLGLDDTPRSPAELAIRLGWTLQATLAALIDLELQGLVRRTAAGRYVAPPGRAGG